MLHCDLENTFWTKLIITRSTYDKAQNTFGFLLAYQSLEEKTSPTLISGFFDYY